MEADSASAAQMYCTTTIQEDYMPSSAFMKSADRNMTGKTLSWSTNSDFYLMFSISKMSFKHRD